MQLRSENLYKYFSILIASHLLPSVCSLNDRKMYCVHMPILNITLIQSTCSHHHTMSDTEKDCYYWIAFWVDRVGYGKEYCIRWKLEVGDSVPIFFKVHQDFLLSNYLVQFYQPCCLGSVFSSFTSNFYFPSCNFRHMCL